VTRYRSPKLVPFAAIVGGGAVLSVIAGRIEPALLAVPFLAVLALGGLAARKRPDVNAKLVMDRVKAIEGDEVDFELHLTNGPGRLKVTFLLDVSSGVELIQAPAAVSMPPHSEGTVRGRLRCKRWGVHVFGGGYVQARDVVSTFVYERRVDPGIELRVYPRTERLRKMLRPRRLRPHLGTWVSRAAGIGLEYADIRQFATGDQRRHINWKATARRRQLHVNLFHPERSSDALILLDAYVDVGGAGPSSLDQSVRAAVSVAAACLEHRDRVGLLAVGGTVEWLVPGTGLRQVYRMVDALMTTQVVFSYAWPTANTIPKHVIAPGALVVCLTALADRRMSALILDLQARGHDVVVVELPVYALLSPAASERERLARRLWSLYGDAVRSRYRQQGIPIAVWDPQRPLRLPIGDLERFRRTSQRAQA
jgi:uncharacterized protein (DUF58 family)